MHTFFETSGGPVYGLGSYGHFAGVNWLWALGLTTFHAVYSIALPILLARLWFPEVQETRWLDRGAVFLVSAIYLFVVALFSVVVGYGPTPGLLALFLAIELLLLYLAYRAPRELLTLRSGRSSIGRGGLVLAGSLEFDAWLLIFIFTASHVVPAVVAGLVFVAFNLTALAIVLRRVGRERLEWSEYYFAVGMLGILFLWDIGVELAIPGILAVTAVFVYFLYRLRRVLLRRELAGPPSGAFGASQA